jgi:hypothetical protein
MTYSTVYENVRMAWSEILIPVRSWQWGGIQGSDRTF